jgi:NTE family protein
MADIATDPATDIATDLAKEPGSDRAAPRRRKRSHGSLIGIALGAGAARGWSHIGALERLSESGIEPDVMAGTSIGALVAGCYAAGRLGELKEFALSLTRRRIFSLLDLSWTGSGLISGDRLRELLDKQLNDLQFADLKVPFVCIATELMTGHEIWLRNGPVGQAIRASYALPGVFRPVQIDHQWLIDGAVVNPIPVSACRAIGARLVVSVSLNSDAFAGTVIQEPHALAGQQPGQNVGSESLVGRTSALRQMLGGSSTPGLTAVLVAAFNISQDRLARSRLAGDPPDVNIIPRAPGVGLFDFDKAAESIAAGRDAAERALPDIELALELLDQAAGL